MGRGVNNPLDVLALVGHHQHVIGTAFQQVHTATIGPRDTNDDLDCRPDLLHCLPHIPPRTIRDPDTRQDHIQQGNSLNALGDLLA